MTQSRVIRIYKAEALYLQSADVPPSMKEVLYNRYTVRFYNERLHSR